MKEENETIETKRWKEWVPSMQAYHQERASLNSPEVSEKYRIQESKKIGLKYSILIGTRTFGDDRFAQCNIFLILRVHIF